MNIEEAKAYLENYKYDNEVYEAIQVLLNELDKKDKVIDMIADTLRYYNGMQQLDEFCYDICENKDCDKDKCKERIVEYFYEKSKEKAHER